MQTLSAHSHFAPHFSTNLCYQGHLDYSNDYLSTLNRSKSFDPCEKLNKLPQQEGLKIRSESSKDQKKAGNETVNDLKDIPRIEQNEEENQVNIKNVTKIPAVIYIDENTPEREYFMRCMVIGGHNTGKHTLINSNFEEKKRGLLYDKKTSDLLIKTATKFKTTKRYHFWVKTLADSSKTKENIWKTYYKSANAFVFVYDTTNKESFKTLEKEVQTILQVIPQERFYGILVGTKNDLKGKREVGINDAIEFQRKYNISYFIETNSMKEEQAGQVLLTLDNKLKLIFEAI